MTVPEIIPDPEYGKCDEESLAVDKEWHGHSLHQ